MRALCEEAVAAALAAGASYADARAIVRRSQAVSTRNRRVDRVDDIESEGIGVRVLVDGAWGFACDRRLDETGVREAAGRATSFAKAAPGKHERALAPVEPVQDEYRTPREQDPIDVPLGDKIALCLAAEEGMQNGDVKVTTAFVRAMRERKVLVSSEGISVDQDLVECGGGIDAMAANSEVSQLRSYPSAHGVQGLRGTQLSESIPTAAEQLGRGGVATWCSATGPLLETVGTFRGFADAQYRDVPQRSVHSGWGREGIAQIARLVASERVEGVERLRHDLQLSDHRSCQHVHGSGFPMSKTRA